MNITNWFKIPARKSSVVRGSTEYTGKLVAAIKDDENSEGRVEYIVVGKQKRLPLSFTTISESNLENCNNDVLSAKRTDVDMDPSHVVAKYDITVMPDRSERGPKTINIAAPAILQFIIDYHSQVWRLNYTIQKIEFGKTSASKGSEANIIAFMEVDISWTELD